MSEPNERDLELAALVCRDVAELPDRDAGEHMTPDDMLVTGDELQPIAAAHIATARAEGDQAGYERGRRGAASLFDAIAHGDEAHRAWLKQAIEDHFAGRPVQKPAGEGGYERGRREAIKECAEIVEGGQETYTATANENRHYLTPRLHGNLAGLAYAEAIRALADRATQPASQPQEQSA